MSDWPPPTPTGLSVGPVDPTGMLFMWGDGRPVPWTILGATALAVALFSSKEELEAASLEFGVGYEKIKQVTGPEFLEEVWSQGARIITNLRRTKHGRVRYTELHPPGKEASS